MLKWLLLVILVMGTGGYLLAKSPALRQTLYYKATGLDKQVIALANVREDLAKLKAEIKTTDNPEAHSLIAEAEADLAEAERLNVPSTTTPFSTSALVLGASVGNTLSKAYQSAAAFTGAVTSSFSNSPQATSTTCR